METKYSVGPVTISLLATAFLTILAVSFFSSSGRDDVYITYWSSYALSHFGEIVNYNGSNVEQSSSLLHTLLLAAINFITGIKIHVIGPIVSLIGAFLALFQTYRLGRLWNRELGINSLVILSTSTFFVYWSVSGFENTLMAFLSVSLVYYLAVCFTEEINWINAVTIFCTVTAFILIRPENLFVILSIIAGFAVLFVILHVITKHRLKREVNAFLFFSLISLTSIFMMVMFRYYYFGDAFPQPVTAKLSGASFSSIEDGYQYFKRNLTIGLGELMIILLSGSLIYLIKEWFSTKKIDLNVTFFVTVSSFFFVFAYTCFIILSGGDWMEGGRFLVPLMPFISLLLAYVISMLYLEKWPKIAALALVVVLQLGISVKFAVSQSTGMPINRGIYHFINYEQALQIRDYTWFEHTNRIHIRDIPMIYYLDTAIGEIVTKKKGKIHLFTQQMGMVPYFLSMKHFKDLEFTDFRGLTDRKFSKCHEVFYFIKSNSGLQVRLKHYLKNQQIYQELCGIEPPDIVFSFGLGNKKGLLDNELYEIIYQQEGHIESGSKFFPGAPVNGAMFVAVKKEYVREAEGIENVKLLF